MNPQQEGRGWGLNGQLRQEEGLSLEPQHGCPDHRGEVCIKRDWLTKMSNTVPKGVSESRFSRYTSSPRQSKRWTFTALLFLLSCFPCKGNSSSALEERWNQVGFRRELQCVSVWCLIQVLGRLGCRARHGVGLQFSINEAEAYHRIRCIAA